MKDRPHVSTSRSPVFEGGQKSFCACSFRKNKAHLVDEVRTVIGKLACCCQMLIWTAARLGIMVVYASNLSKAVVTNLESRYLYPLGHGYEDLVPRFRYDGEWNGVIRCIEWLASEAYGQANARQFICDLDLMAIRTSGKCQACPHVNTAAGAVLFCHATFLSGRVDTY